MIEEVGDAQPEAELRRPLGAHLEELRARVIWVVVAAALGGIVGALFIGPLYRILVHPYVAVAPGPAPVLSGKDPWTSLGILTKVMIAGAAFTGLPVALWQGIAFVAPGLRGRERSAVRAGVGFGSALFCAGAAFAYFYLVPVALRFAIALEILLGIRHAWFADQTLGFILPLVLLSGVVFELPLLMAVLARVGILRSVHFRGRTRYAILAAFVVGAVLTPPDVVSQILLSTAMLALYGVGVWLIARLEPKVS